MYKCLLNTTFVVESEILPDFYSTLKEIYFPEVTSAEIFGQPQVARVLTQLEPETESIAVQLPAISVSLAGQWLDSIGNKLHSNITQKHNGKVLLFSTLMEKIEI